MQDKKMKIKKPKKLEEIPMVLNNEYLYKTGKQLYKRITKEHIKIKFIFH